jgi:hypothetical protein
MVKRHEEKISQAVTKFFIYLIQSFYIFHSHYSETSPLCMDRIILQHPVYTIFKNSDSLETSYFLEHPV